MHPACAGPGGYDMYRRVECERQAEPTHLDCAQCDNRFACGICLVTIEARECPARGDMSAMHQCLASKTAIGAMCEGDGECGSDSHLNQCAPRVRGARIVL